MRVIREIRVPDRWMVHSYYTISPYAPDGSGRLLAAGADLSTRNGEVLILDAAGKVEQRFGSHPVESSFFHTGFWQSWSPDGRFVSFQNGSLKFPCITRRELATGEEITLEGDLEGAPPSGGPAVSALLGMLYAAGYGYGVYSPAIAPIPFEARDRHGIFEYDFDRGESRLVLSVQQILDSHPDRARLLELDRELAVRNGTSAGLTLMCYCVRWSRDGERMMFHFGNHCVVKERQEPKIMYIFSCRRDFSDLKLTLDLCGGGVHWSFRPDGEGLIGYAKLPGYDRIQLAEVELDGSNLRAVADSDTGGHPSISPVDPTLAVTDSGSGEVSFYNLASHRLIETAHYANRLTDDPELFCGRNEFRVCHHPVFSGDGRRVLFNLLDRKESALCEIEVPR